MSRNLNLTVLTLSVLSLLASGCGGKEASDIQFEDTPVISGGLGYCIVSLAYVRLKAEARSEADDSGFARRGDLLRLTARARAFEGKDAGVWYKVEGESASGWLPEAAMTVYRTETQAREALKDSE